MSHHIQASPVFIAQPVAAEHVRIAAYQPNAQQTREARRHGFEHQHAPIGCGEALQLTIPLTYGQYRLEVEVEYTPEEPATWEDPGFENDLSVIAVWLKGVDIYDLLSQSTVDEIGDGAIEAIRAMDREEV